MMQVVGISEKKVSANPEDHIITYSLGSCVGLALYDPASKVGGMVHCMLPLSASDPEKASRIPEMYTDTGVVSLLEEMIRQGAQKGRLVAKVAGGANALDPNDRFKIGERNVTVLRKVLWKNNIMIAAEDTGGKDPRTLSLLLNDGKTTIKSLGNEKQLG